MTEFKLSEKIDGIEIDYSTSRKREFENYKYRIKQRVKEFIKINEEDIWNWEGDFTKEIAIEIMKHRAGEELSCANNHNHQGNRREYIGLPKTDDTLRGSEVYMKSEEKGRKITKEQALNLMIQGNDWLKKNFKKGDKCTCGCCYVCAYNKLEASHNVKEKK